MHVAVIGIRLAPCYPSAPEPARTVPEAHEGDQRAAARPADARASAAEALHYCRQPAHLRRTLRIAAVVGLVLTAINQLDVILGGDAGALTWVKVALNFVVPFVVSNLGLLSGRATRRERS